MRILFLTQVLPYPLDAGPKVRAFVRYEASMLRAHEVLDTGNVLLGGDAPAFAEATARLLTDPQLNARLRVTDRASAEERNAWQAVYRRVDEIYGGLTGKVVS